MDFIAPRVLASSLIIVTAVLATSGCHRNDRTDDSNVVSSRSATSASSARMGATDHSYRNSSDDDKSRTSSYDNPRTSRMSGMTEASRMMSVDAQGVNDLLAQWAERPRLGATQMIAKYGQPQEATSYRMVWHNPGPFKRISVMNIETPHDFPLPHVDYMEHTITYNVPQDKVADLIAFDGSSTINRTAGELSARCDLEGHNVLTLNLDHDIVTGKTTVEGARKAFGEMVDQDIKGKHPAYVEALQFTPDQASRAEFPDSPVIPGSPQRAAVARESDGKGDSEVLATVIAIDLNQVLAASQAQTKKIGQPVKEFAKMLHKVHGAHMVETMQLGQRIGVTPIITSSVEKLQRDGAGALSLLVPLDGDAFAGAYIDAMVRGHENVLTIIDKELTKNASIADVQQHLEAMRDHVAQHLEKAKALQGSMQLNRAR